MKNNISRVREVVYGSDEIITEAEVSQVESHPSEEAGDGPGQQHAGLRLVVGDVARVLDELGQVDLVEGEAANARDELLGGSVGGSGLDRDVGSE